MPTRACARLRADLILWMHSVFATFDQNLGGSVKPSGSVTVFAAVFATFDQNMQLSGSVTLFADNPYALDTEEFMAAGKRSNVAPRSGNKNFTR